MDFKEKQNEKQASKQILGDIILMSSEALEAETRVEVDMQVATAKKYPRNLAQVLSNIEYLATQDQETAESCFYALKRDGKTITGATVRLAEIISTCWGNMRSQAKIIANDGRTITAQGTCWDLETNVAYSVEVRRKITNKDGYTYSEDMQIVSANACCSIALRNAVFKCIPMAITRKIQERIKNVMLGDEESFEDVKQKALRYYIDLGITKGQILKLLQRERIEHITREDVFVLRGISTAIADGDTTLASAFNPPKNVKKGMSGKLTVESDIEIEETEIIDEKEVSVTGFSVESTITNTKGAKGSKK